MASGDTDLSGKCLKAYKRNSWAREQTIDQSQLGERARNCRRIEIAT